MKTEEEKKPQERSAECTEPGGDYCARIDQAMNRYYENHKSGKTPGHRKRWMKRRGRKAAR